jgi:SAM-dependent methyltransferase
MNGPDEGRAGRGFDFYGPQYARFYGELATELRREVYDEDIGQQGWRTAAEQAEIAELLRLSAESHVLDVACGAGGPSLQLVERTGCRIAGLDAEAAGIAHAQAHASERRVADRATFAVLDCGGPLPFPDATFDAILCIDAICHLPDRFATLFEWARLLRPGGRLLFSDPVILTGAVAKAELDIRAATGFFLFVAPGINEEAIKAAGLELLRCEDRTAATVEIATRWHAARARHAAALQRDEGADWFEQRQRFLATTAELSSSRRLSRYFYLAEKQADDPTAAARPESPSASDRIDSGASKWHHRIPG